MQHALGFARRARGIEDEQRVFGLHLLRRAIVRHLGHRLVIPDVAARNPRDLAARAAHDEAGLDRGAAQQRLIDIALERNMPPAAKSLIRSDDAVGIAILDAADQALGGEAAEHHAMHRADARAGEHGVGCLGDHRHVDGDDVALLDAAGLQHIGHAADALIGLAIGDVLLLAGAVAFPDDRRVIGRRRQMPVEAVGRDVQRAVVIPADMDIARVADVLHLRIGLDPVQALALLAPEFCRIGERGGIERVILGLVDPGGAGERCRDREKIVVGHGASGLPAGIFLRSITAERPRRIKGRGRRKVSSPQRHRGTEKKARATSVSHPLSSCPPLRRASTASLERALRKSWIPSGI